MKESVDLPGEHDPGPGRRIAIDVGTVRIGVAVSDRDAHLAMPVETVHRVTPLDGYDGDDVDRLEEICREYHAVEVVIGLPRDLKGNGSVSVRHARDIARRLARRLGGVPVRMADERLSTKAATVALRRAGVTARAGRSVIDQAAAVEILQTWLDGRRRALDRSPAPPACTVTPGDLAGRTRSPRPGQSPSTATTKEKLR